MSKKDEMKNKKTKRDLEGWEFQWAGCVVLSIFAMISTVFIGFTFYEFWAKWVAPVASLASITPAGWILSKFLPQKPDPPRAFVKQYGYIIVGAFGGIFLGIALTIILHTAGCRFPYNPPKDGTVDIPAATASTGETWSEGPEDGGQTGGDVPIDNEGPDSGVSNEQEGSTEEGVAGADVDVKEPETTAVVSAQTDDEDIYLPAGDPRYLVEIIDPALVAYHSERTGEDVAEWVALISDHMKMKINSDAQEDANTINRNRAFTDYTDRAQKIEQDIDQNGMDTEALRTMIGLRENAFGIYPTKELRLLLANDYHKLAITQNRDEDWGSAYSSYVQAISYEMLYVKMVRETDADYYYHLYKIGTLYQCLGDMATIDKEHRREAYFLSACFLEIVARSGVLGEKYAFMSNYYTGMVNHKLYLMEQDDCGRKFNYYLADAIHFYEASLDFKNYQLQQDSQKRTLKNLYSAAQKYVKQYGRPDNMLSADEYARLASKCG